MNNRQWKIEKLKRSPTNLRNPLNRLYGERMRKYLNFLVNKKKHNAAHEPTADNQQGD